MIIMCFILAGRLHFQWYFQLLKLKKKIPVACFAIHNFVFLISITQVSLSRNKLHIHEPWFAVMIISEALYLWRLQVLESLFSGNYIILAQSWGSWETPHFFIFSLKGSVDLSEVNLPCSQMGLIISCPNIRRGIKSI